MTMQRRLGNRQTSVGPADPRVVGRYEQTIDWPAVTEFYRTLANDGRHHASIECSGRVRHERSFDLADIVGLARVRSNGLFSVSLIDVFAAVGLLRDADVAVIGANDGGQIAVPLRHIVRSEQAGVVLGSSHRPLAHTGRPLRLNIPGWTDDIAPMCPTTMRFLAFEEFVQWA